MQQSFRSTWKWIAAASVCGALSVPAFGQGTGAGVQPAVTAQPQAVTQGAYTISGESAIINCIHKLAIAAQADGLIEELNVDEGSIVKKGDLLLKIDDRLARAELGVASKEAEAAEAQAKQDANLLFAKKAAEVSDAEYEEWKDLYERNAASYQEVRRKMLEAQKARLGIRVSEVDHQKDQLTAEVAKEKVNAAKVQLDLRNVFSPYDGIIVERLRDQGEWVKAGEPVLRLVHLNEMRVEARVNLKQKGISTIQLQNAPITITVMIGDKPLVRKAHIQFVSPEVELGSCRVSTRIENQPFNGGWLLSDGMEANVEIAPVPLPLP
ncbi:MAG: HlyD family efflux transporter periplasmic adaptor subunit [Pirellulales bacterium]